MKSMTIPELYEYLCSPQFQDENSGNIFYNYYHCCPRKSVNISKSNNLIVTHQN